MMNFADNNFDLNPSLYFVNVELDTELGKIVFYKRKYETETKSLVQMDKIADIIRGVNLPSRRQIETQNG
jgi:type I restriction enzyme M protein